MPFGEEIFFIGGRTSGLGYGSDNVRKKFTGYERDSESDLDFAQARYFASSLARFSSPDPLLSSGRIENPKTWNRYAYTNNNPLIFVDPLGLYVCKAGKTKCDQFDAALDKGRAELAKIESKYGKQSRQYKMAERALAVYGEKGINNGVFILGKDGKGAARTRTNGTTVAKTRDNPTGQKIEVEFDNATFSNSNFEEVIAHEGSHAADGADWVKSGFKDIMNPTEYKTELDAYTVSSLIAEAGGHRSLSFPLNVNLNDPLSRFGAFPYSAEIWNSSWTPADVETMRTNGINKLLEFDKVYTLTPTMKSPKKAFNRKDRF